MISKISCCAPGRWSRRLKRVFPDEPLKTPFAVQEPPMGSVFERLNEIRLCGGAEGGKA